MAVSQINPHFFQPLLPGFQSHLKIPVKFFSMHLKGKHEGKTVNLRTDASERTWDVKMESNRLTEGWKEFVEAHDLRIGDFLVFRHEGDMLFHVTVLGPSCCEIQYAQSRSHEENEESDDTESDEPSSDLNCFSQSVTASNLSRDRVGVNIKFAKRNGLTNERQEIVLMNEEGKSWDSELKCFEDCRVLIVRGWTSFCTENKLQVGDSCTFRLLQNTETPVFQLCSRTIAETKNRFVKLTPTLNSLHTGKQHLPASFTRENGIFNPGKIILVDKNRAEWSMWLKVDASRGRSMYIFSGHGWKGFCDANEVGVGESLILELVRRGVTPLLKFSSKTPFEAEARARKRSRVQKLNQETSAKLKTREKTAVEGEPSRAFNKPSANHQGNLQHKKSCSVSDQMAKVKQCVADTLTSINRFQAELGTMEQNLKDSLQEFNNLARGEDNGTSEKQSTLPLPTEDALPKDLNLSAHMYTVLRDLRAAFVKEHEADGVMPYHIFTDLTLYHMSIQIPRTKEELHKINGLSEFKVRKFGDRLLETIESTLNEYYGN